jgi:O-succinylhomoserine sulfhydrylase
VQVVTRVFDPQGRRPDTLAVRGGLVRTEFEETAEALFLTQGYVYPRAADAESAFAGELDRYVYSRYGNPTIAAFEERLRLMEGAEACYATATGMAAVFVTLAATAAKPGARVVAGRALFGSTVVVLDDVLGGYGVRTEYVDAHRLDAWAEALATPADVVFLETPSNPMLDIADVAEVSRLAHAAGAVVVVDNVFATSILQRPLELGADVVVYSATKHIDGQGRVMGGAILGSREFIDGRVTTLIRNTGPSMSAFNAWVLLKGLETLSLRVRAQSASALRLAQWLRTRPEVADVRYPFLDTHPQSGLAMAQMTAGGTVVTFTLGVPVGATDGTARKRTFAFLDALRLVDISNNLGDAKSLITHPPTTTHRKIGVEGRRLVGISESTVRLSVGLEDVEDLAEDVAQALEAST